MAAAFQRDKRQASLPRNPFIQDKSGSCHQLQSLPQPNRARKLVCAHGGGKHRPTHPFGTRAAASQGKLSPTSRRATKAATAPTFLPPGERDDPGRALCHS